MGRAEAYVEDYLRKESRRRGWLCYKFVSPGRSGVPDDIIVTDRGVVAFVECKSSTGRLSALQVAQITHLQEHQTIVRVVFSRDEVDKVLDDLDTRSTYSEEYE